MDSDTENNFSWLHEKYKKFKVLQKECNAGTEMGTAWKESEIKRILTDVISFIDDIFRKIDSSNKYYFRYLGMKVSLMHEEAKMISNSGNESSAMELLSNSLNITEECWDKPEIIFITLRLMNHLSYLMAKKGDMEQPQKILEEAEVIYNSVKKVSDKPALFTAEELFENNEVIELKNETVTKLERLITNNYQMLGFIYNKQGKEDKFMFCLYEMLKRQLETKDTEPVAWVSKCARLAYYFISKEKFKEARHHLSAACYQLQEYENELKFKEITPESMLRWEELQRCYAEVAKCWIRYGLSLFGSSKSRFVSMVYGDSSQCLDNVWAASVNLLHQEESDLISNEEKEDNHLSPKTADSIQPCGGDVSNSNFLSRDEEKYLKNENSKKETCQLSDKGYSENSERPKLGAVDIIFENQDPNNINSKAPRDNKNRVTFSDKNEANTVLEYPFKSIDVSAIEEQVAAEFVENTEQARSLFLYTHSWLNRIKMFYKPREHPMEYVNTILDLSELYRHLAFYEEDIESQYSVHKKRSDALETLSCVLREVRPHCYLEVSIELIRELAEVQLEMMGLNLRRLYIAQEGRWTTDSPDIAEQKLEALADIHSRLEQFGDYMANGSNLGDASYSETTDLIVEPLPYFS